MKYLNVTNFEHAIFAMLLQVALSFVMDVAAAGAVAVAVFFGREYAQVEYSIRAQTGRSLTAMMPWHVLKPRLWSVDAVMDVMLPAIGCATIAIMLGDLW